MRQERGRTKGREQKDKGDSWKGFGDTGVRERGGKEGGKQKGKGWGKALKEEREKNPQKHKTKK